MDGTVLLHRDEHIATVTINRPEKLNALNKATWQRLGDTIASLSDDHRVRCIILRGAGERAFSPGNDISEFETERGNVEQARRYGSIMHATLGILQECPHPLIALIRGVCVGGGLELAACCDIRICGRSSRFGIPVNRLGLVMAYPEIRTLLQLVSRAVIMEMLLEGRILTAEEARERGLVTRVVADETVEETARETAQRIASGAPLVNRWHKKFLRRLTDPNPLSPSEIDEGYACFGTEDFDIGYRAFLAKADPEFIGR